MKVFTVGLDQKPPLEKAPDTPPPGYSSPGGSTALPMGPETTPIYVKKAKSYKGVLVCMLAVFLIGLFALTLSEIAYNRQRDENFFRLRWAELKHKMGYDMANAERVFTLRRQQEIQTEPIVPQNLQAPATTSTIKPPIVDSSVERNEDEQAITANDRLAFFRRLLEGIKKHAEEMGFDGTMQVSVLQVDPETLQQQLRERLQHSEEANMDGFGEWAMPQQPQQQGENPSRFGGFRFEDDYNGDFEQPKQERFRGFNNWQMPTFDHWTANRVDTPFFPPRPFWWQQQHQRPQTPFFFQQGPMPQQLQQQQPQSSFLQNEVFPQQQQPQQPQVIFFPNHNINQFQQQQQPQFQQPQFPSPPEINIFHPHAIAPEDRIQIEPPSTPEQLQRWKMNNQKPFDFKSNEGPRAWTHNENDGLSEPLPSWAIENSLESETPFAEIVPEESHENSPNAITSDAIPRPPAIQPDNTESSHLNILPLKEVQGEQSQTHSGEITNDHDNKITVNDEPEPPKESQPLEVDFPAVKFPISDDINNKHREPIFFQIDDPHPSQIE